MIGKREERAHGEELRRYRVSEKKICYDDLLVRIGECLKISPEGIKKISQPLVFGVPLNQFGSGKASVVLYPLQAKRLKENGFEISES